MYEKRSIDSATGMSKIPKALRSAETPSMSMKSKRFIDLYDAVLRGDEDAVRRLAPEYRRQDVNDDGIMSFAHAENPSMIPTLVASGINVDERDTIGCTTLMNAAAVDDDTKLILWLLDNGANINAANEYGETAFSYACAWERLNIAQLLYERGANINCVHSQGGTPLDYARSNSPKTLEFLIGIGAKQEKEIN